MAYRRTGLGQCGDGTLDCLVPGGPQPPAATTTSTVTSTAVDTSQTNALQDFVNSLSPAQWQAYQNANSPSQPAPAVPFQWGAFVLGLLGLFAVAMMVKK